MSSNRLFIYDAEENIAVCIAKGYSTGWSSCGDSEYQNNFYDEVLEFTGNIKSTRLELKTEDNLPDCKVYWPSPDFQITYYKSE